MKRIAIAVHGGAGGLPQDQERLGRLRAGALAAVEAGHAVLARGGSALDAVEAAVVLLEDDPEFNAGRGATPTEDGGVELDASVMEGRRREAGAVAALEGVRNPVRAARAVLADGRHVLLAGAAAAGFAADAGVPFAPPSWFVAGRRRRPARDAPRGTVGAVARDGAGHLAAATSTGGVAGQRRGRVGDSPLIGAGTWADDATAAVSCTGTGEAIIRAALAHEVDALMRHRGLPLGDACATALAALARYGGDGGLVAVGARGDVAAPFTAPAMTRAWRVGHSGAVAAVGPGAGV